MSRYNIVSTIFLVLLLGSLMLDGALDITWVWYGVIAAIYLVITIYGSMTLSSQYFVKVHSSGSPDSKAIALTFDDGPIPGHTEKILDILKKYDAPAAFFCVGSRAASAPALLQRIHTEGHLIGNHSYGHGKFFDLLPGSRMTSDLVHADVVIKEHTGLTPRFFRPPYGVTNPMVANAVKRRNYTVVGWTLRSLDSVTKDEQKLFNRITRTVRAGDVVLFHDYSDAMIAILPAFVEHIHHLGLKIVRLDTLIQQKPYV